MRKISHDLAGLGPSENVLKLAAFSKDSFV